MKLLLICIAIALFSACDPCVNPLVPGATETCAIITVDGASERR